MKTTTGLLLAGVICCAMATAAGAIDLGDPAPALQVAKWVKGSPVDLAACLGTNVVVVEFWATWCPPCRASIPHLTELQKKLAEKGVLIVGISDEDEEVIEPFVKDMGDRMDYSVGVDEDQATTRAYLQAFDVRGIPHAFVVDRAGRIAWHGHPMEMETPLEQVIAGTYDIGKARKKADAQQKLQELWQLVYGNGDEEKIKALAEELAVLDREAGGIMSDNKPFNLAEIRKWASFSRLSIEYQRAVANNEGDAKLDEIAAKMKACAPDEFDTGQLQDVRLQMLAKLYFKEASSPAPDGKSMAELAGRMVSVPTTNSVLLNDISWMIMTDESVETRDMELALKLAKSAIDLCGGNDAAIADTYARALFENKRVKEAIEYQQKSVDLTTDENLRMELTVTLKRYEDSLKQSQTPPPAPADEVGNGEDAVE